MTKNEAMKMALDALVDWDARGRLRIIEALRTALAQPEPEPVAWRFDLAKYRENDLRGRQWAFNIFSQTKPYMDEMVRNVTPLYTAPPQREWVELTDGDIEIAYIAGTGHILTKEKDVRQHANRQENIGFAKAIAYIMREKNNG